MTVGRLMVEGLAGLLAVALALVGGFTMADEATASKLAKATFGGGCFWCTEAVYAQVKGVKSVTSGYIGGEQGADVGTQYRSGVFYHDDEQKRIAEEVIKRLDAARAFPAPIVTEVTKATTFYPAEDYHQDYFANNPRQPYCQGVVAPKVDKVRKVFKDLLAK